MYPRNWVCSTDYLKEVNVIDNAVKNNKHLEDDRKKYLIERPE